MCCESLRLSLRFLDLCTCIHFANVRFSFSSALCSETIESLHFCLVTMRCLFFTTPIPGRLGFRPHSFAAEHSIYLLSSILLILLWFSPLYLPSISPDCIYNLLSSILHIHFVFRDRICCLYRSSRLYLLSSILYITFHSRLYL